MTSLSPFSLKELESQVRCLEKEATELKEAVEQQKVKNNVSAEKRGCEAGLVGIPPLTTQERVWLPLYVPSCCSWLEACLPLAAWVRPPFPFGSVIRPRADSLPIGLGHVPKHGAPCPPPYPHPMVGSECTSWSGLGHMVTLE